MMSLARNYPDTWHIDDWDNPWLPLPFRLLNTLPKDLIGALVKLDEKTLLHKARKSTGLTDFGDTGFLAPLRLLLQDLQNANNISNLGRITVQAIFLQQLTARLCVEDNINHHPELEELPVHSPIIISGLPRTGTTHLHNLIAQSSQIRFIPLWQTLNPALPTHASKDQRRRLNAVRLALGHYILPLFQRMHEMELEMPHEEVTLSALSFRSFMFEGAFELPGYLPWYTSEKHHEGYNYLKKVLQVLQKQNDITDDDRQRRWILKSPQHVDQLDTIADVFPDAKIIRTHRDPVRAVISLITMVLYATRQVYSQIDRKHLARLWVERLETMLRASEEQAERLDKTQVLNINFSEFMENQEDTAIKVLEFSGIEVDNNSLMAIRQHLSSHTRDRHGRIDYRFEDFGLDENEIRERFSFYKY